MTTDRPTTTDERADHAPDRPDVAALHRIPDTPADPRQYEGRYLTAEIKEALTGAPKGADEAAAGPNARSRTDSLDQVSTRPDTRHDAAADVAEEAHEVQRPQLTGDYYAGMPPVSFERYLVRDRSRPVPVFDGPPAREQAVQGRVGDCGVIAALGAVAGHRPEDLRQVVKQVEDDTCEITLHDVTPADHHDPVARPTGRTTVFRVDDRLPVAQDEPSLPPAGAQVRSCGWPALLEKAIAAQDQAWDAGRRADWADRWDNSYKSLVDGERTSNGLPPSPNDRPAGYDRLDVGSSQYDRATLLAELTGREAEVRQVPPESAGEQALLDEFRDQLDDGKPILVAARGRSPGEAEPFYGFAFGHAYEVVSVADDKIHLQNPWGDLFNPPPVDAKAFWDYYQDRNDDGTRYGRYATLK